MKNTPTESELKTGVTYTVYLGGDKTSSPVKSTILVKTKEGSDTPDPIVIQLGDCDGVDGIDLADATAIIKHFLGSTTLVDDSEAGTYYYTAAEKADGVDGIDLADATAVIKHFLGSTILGTYEIK